MSNQFKEEDVFGAFGDSYTLIKAGYKKRRLIWWAMVLFLYLWLIEALGSGLDALGPIGGIIGFVLARIIHINVYRRWAFKYIFGFPYQKGLKLDV